jgi:hypothetical protein
VTSRVNHSRPLLRTALAAVFGLAAATTASGQQSFSFSKAAEQEKAEQQAADEARNKRIVDRLSTPCRQAIKDKKIMVIIGEQQTNGVVLAEQQNYGPHFQLINSRLRALGLRTFTPEEIRKQIAQAEIDAYFRNDPDAALAASRKLGANFILRGLITSQSMMNPIIRVNQVSVGMGFTLASASGKSVADAAASSASYSGADTRAMALTLLNEQADDVVSKLYSDYCRNAEDAAPKKGAK